MAAKLAPGKSISRELQLRIFDAPVIVTMSTEGITLAAKRHKPINITWGMLVDASATPSNAPAKYNQQPFQYVVDCISRSKKRA